MAAIIYYAVGIALTIPVYVACRIRGRRVRSAWRTLPLLALFWPVTLLPILAVATVAGLGITLHLSVKRAEVIDLLMDGPIGQALSTPK